MPPRKTKQLPGGEADVRNTREAWATARSSAVYDPVPERSRAVALARHFREAEGLSIVPIADRWGCLPATIEAYFDDPTGEKGQAVKARYVGVCSGCGAYTRSAHGKGDAYR